MNEAKLRQLADLEAIRDLVRRYAHCVWQKDVVGVVDLFSEDAEMDMGDRPTIVGREALLASYSEAFATSSFRPFVHNHVIELNDEVAEGTVYLDLHSIAEGKPMTGQGFYKDRYARIGDAWKITYRVLTLSDYREG